MTEEEAIAQKRWYFHPYCDIPDAFKRALQQNRVAFVNYSDEWGTFRSVALPQTSAGGRRFLACADYEISYIKQLLKTNFNKSILTGCFFLLLTIPFIVAFTLYNRQLQHANKELALHRSQLEKAVQARTADLQTEKERAENLVRNLERALADIKTLSGLLPICSNCKKVRDDQGYWKQIEGYIQEHTEAEFSHGICPECSKKLYPELQKDE